MPRHYHLATQTAAGPAVVDEAPATASTSADVIGPIRRRTIDTVLIAAGALVAVVLLVAGGLLTWGSRFADDYVSDELTSQNIFFPDAAAWRRRAAPTSSGSPAQQVTTGAEAEAYASYIGGHLEETADGATYADLGGPQRRGQGGGRGGPASGATRPPSTSCRPTPTTITGQRDRLFRGETLRGLLLSTFAWSTIGRIAGIAAIAAFVAAAAMIVLVVLGIVHRRTQRPPDRPRRAAATGPAVWPGLARIDGYLPTGRRSRQRRAVRPPTLAPHATTMPSADTSTDEPRDSTSSSETRALPAQSRHWTIVVLGLGSS